MKISIIGAAGHVGSCAAFNIAIHRVASELVMIDNYSPDKLSQYVYDLTSAVTGLDVKVRAGDYPDMRNSDIVLVAAGSANVVASRLEVLRPNLPLIKDFAGKIREFCPEAVVITATNPVDPLNYAMYLFTRFERQRLLGYSANDSIRFRMFLAEVMGISSSRVDATVIGEHGNSQVLLFSSVKVDGKPVRVSEEVKQKVLQEVANLPPIMEGLRIKTGRTSAWTTSMGLTALCRAIAEDSSMVMPCSVVLNGEYGCSRMSISVPVVIGRNGFRKIEQLELFTAEQAALERSINTLKPAMEYVEEFLAKQDKQS